MKGILIALGVILALYVIDQQFADGRYTDALQRMMIQIRRSFGV